MDTFSSAWDCVDEVLDSIAALFPPFVGPRADPHTKSVLAELLAALEAARASVLVPCEHCGQVVPQSSTRPRRFCSDACRKAASRA